MRALTTSRLASFTLKTLVSSQHRAALAMTAYGQWQARKRQNGADVNAANVAIVMGKKGDKKAAAEALWWALLYGLRMRGCSIAIEDVKPSHCEGGSEAVSGVTRAGRLGFAVCWRFPNNTKGSPTTHSAPRTLSLSLLPPRADTAAQASMGDAKYDLVVFGATGNARSGICHSRALGSPMTTVCDGVMVRGHRPLGRWGSVAPSALSESEFGQATQLP